VAGFLIERQTYDGLWVWQYKSKKTQRIFDVVSSKNVDL